MHHIRVTAVTIALLFCLQCCFCSTSSILSKKLDVVVFGDDNMLGTHAGNRTSARYLLRHLLMFDDFLVNYVGPLKDDDGLNHYCKEGAAPIPKDGRDADHIWNGELTPFNWNLAIVSLGMHDCARMTDSFDRIFRSIGTLERIVSFLRRNGNVKVMVVKVPPTNDMTNECITAYNEMVEETFTQEMSGVPVTVVAADIKKGEHIDRTMWRLNEEGQRMVAGALYTAITEWYKDERFKQKKAQQEL